MTRKTTNLFESELRRELRKILTKTVLLRAASGLLTFVALAGWVFLVVVVWAALTGAPTLSHALFFSRTAAVVLGLLFVAVVVYPLIKTPSLRTLTFQLESRKDFQDLVAAGYEFSQSEDAAERYSPDLIREVIRQAVRSVQGLEVRFLFLDRRQALLVPLAYGALGVLVILSLVSPATLLDAGERLVAPREVAIVPREANLFCSPGNITVLSGSDVDVVARDFGGSDQPVTLSYNLSHGFWKTESTRERDTVERRGATSPETVVGEHVYTFKDIRGTVSYYFERGENRTPTYTITVVNKPVVTDLTLILTPPAYTKEGADTLIESGGNVHALEGTHVAVYGKANNVLDEAWVVFDGKDREPVESTGREFAFDFVAVQDGSYSISLKDTLAHDTDTPLVYTIDVYEDHPPVLDVLEPGNDATLPRNAIVNLGFMAADDFGVQEAAVFYRRGGDERFEKTRIPLGPHGGEREILATFEWSLEGMVLFPGDYVEYFVEVKDNNVATGPGVTKSRVFHISVPTMAELYEQVEEESARRTDLVEEALREGEELKARVEKLSREMKKTDEMDWSRQKEIDKAIASEEKIQEKLEEVQKSLDETLQSLSENQMTSQQIGEKLEEISRLIEEINSEALNKYMEEMREAMAKLDPEQVQKALENVNMSAEDLLKSLERTESLLKEIQQEQKMEELVRDARDLMEAQEKLSDETVETEAGDQEALDKLSDEQETLAERADELEEKLDEFSEEQEDEELAAKLQEASEDFSRSRTSKEMTEASSQLQQGQKNQAMSHQEKASDNLMSLFGKLANLQAEMQASSGRRAAENLQRLANSTLEISFKQEALTHQLREQISARDGSNREVARELAKQQQTYARGVQQIADELHEISRRTLAVPQNLLRSLGQCQQDMESSQLFLEQDKPFMSTTKSSQATTALNQITIDLLSACKNCSGGGSSSQSEGSPQLQRLLAGQQQVLKETEHLLSLRLAQERLRQEMQAGVERLAGQQRSLKEIAEQVRDDMQKNEHVLGRMDKVVSEMEEVLRDFEGGRLDESTLRKETRILSRLLDAQRSIHTRDYEKKRLSASADDVFSRAGGASEAKPAAQALREEIRRAMALKAPGEYEDLIRMYFRALAEEAAAGRGDR